MIATPSAPRLSAPPLGVAFGLLFGCLGCLGCQPGADLGACDIEAARAAAFVAPFEGDATGLAGQPMFEGQALLAASCGNGSFCHSEISSVESRYGVPAGLEFDVRLACDLRAPAEACPRDRVDRLRRNQGQAFRHARAIFEQVQLGAMPPGEIGRSIRADAPTFLRVDGSPLPELDTEEGREILRNWLACGTPVLEAAEDVPPELQPGDYCGDLEVGDCVYGLPRVFEVPEPTWPSIYELVIDPLCGSTCHGPGDPDYRVESQLDLSDIDLAYDQMVSVTATGAFCNMDGRAHIEPGDPAGSLLLDKLEDGSDCGDRMPQGGPFLPEETMEVLRQWIMDGAPRGATP